MTDKKLSAGEVDRELFEAWIVQLYRAMGKMAPDLARVESGESYFDPDVSNAWTDWQHSTALSQQPAQAVGYAQLATPAKFVEIPGGYALDGAALPGVVRFVAQQPECGKAQLHVSGSVPDERDVLLAEARMVIAGCLSEGDLPAEISWMAERASKGRRIYVDDRALAIIPDHPQSPDAGALVEALEAIAAEDYEAQHTDTDREISSAKGKCIWRMRARARIALDAFRAQGNGA